MLPPPITDALYTERTVLTLLTEDDLPAMEAMAREPDTFKYIKKLERMSEEEYTRFLHLKLQQIKENKGYHWAVWLAPANGTSLISPGDVNPAPKINPASSINPAPTAGSSKPFIGGLNQAPTVGSSGTFIGAVNLNPIAGTGRLQIGCQLKRDFWGQGFASELTARVLTFAIHELRLPAVYGVFEKGNNVSRRLLEKLGFVFEERSQEKEVEVETHVYTSPLTPDSHTR